MQFPKFPEFNPRLFGASALVLATVVALAMSTDAVTVLTTLGIGITVAAVTVVCKL